MKMNNLMKHAQRMQKQMMEIQEELANRTVEASVGGGMVTVTANGQQDILAIMIDPEVVDPNDIEMLQYAGLGVAMKNAQDVLKEHADDITEYDNLNDGLYHYLTKFFETKDNQ